jgi:hypothetical protein
VLLTLISRRKTETLIDASRQTDVKVYVEETKYILMSFRQNVGQNYDTKTANNCFENVARLKYFGTTVNK